MAGPARAARRLAPLLLLLAAAAAPAPARAASLRNMYIDSNGQDVRLEVLVDRWWAEGADEAVEVPAGTRLKNRTGPTTLADSDVLTPTALRLRLTNPTLDSTARLSERAAAAEAAGRLGGRFAASARRCSPPALADLPLPSLPLLHHRTPVFSILPESGSTISLRLVKLRPVSSCTGLSPSACNRCGNATWATEVVVVPFQRGGFATPPVASAASFQATLTAATGWRASATWEGPFPRSVQGDGSDPAATMWLAYLPGAAGDTGRIVTDGLADQLAVWSEAFPEGACAA